MSNMNNIENENNYGNGGFAPGADDNNDAVTENIFEEKEKTDVNTENTVNGQNEANEYPARTERIDSAPANGFRAPDSLDGKSENVGTHNNIRQTEEVPQEASHAYAPPQTNTADNNYRPTAYQAYNNMDSQRTAANNAPQYPHHQDQLTGTQRQYTPCPRPVGESAGIRYNADKTSADGNYTWQYCQNGKPTAAETPKKKKRGVFKTVALSVASLLAVGLVGFGIYMAVDYFGNADKADPEKGDPVIESPNNGITPDQSENFSLIVPDNGKEDPDAQTVVVTPGEDGTLSKQMIAVKCKPSSVGIEVSATSHSYFGSYKTSGVGSGFILTENGYIATNNHVIEGAEEITVMLDDGTRHKAEIIGADSVTDLAVIKIEAEGLIPMEIGDSDLMRVGDSVIAIGTPAGIEFAGTVTDGIVSAVNRPVEVQGSNGYTKTMTLMQTNAAINPGNSGGPLINNKGQVIGINTLKLTEEYEGIGFSIPINSATTIFNQLIKDGKVTDYEQSFVTGTGAIGITNYFEVTEEESKYYGIPVGVMVIQLKPGSASQAAGLKRGDIITGFNGQKVTTVAEINKLKSSFKAGDEVTLTVYRDPTEIVDITFKLDVMG